MNDGKATDWETCTDQRRIKGFMRELFLWETPLRVMVGVATEVAEIVDLIEPEEQSDPGPRRLKVRTPTRILADTWEVCAENERHKLRWTSTPIIEGDVATIAVPGSLDIQTLSCKPVKELGRDISSVFCQSGAITGPFIRAQRSEIRAFSNECSREWSNNLIIRRMEYHNDRVVGYISAVRVGDGLVMITDTARDRPENGPSAKNFIGRSMISIAEFAQKIDPGTRILISWAPNHPLWRDFDRFLKQQGSAKQLTNLSTLYTRFTPAPDQFRTAITLSPLPAQAAHNHFCHFAEPAAVALAKDWGVGEQFEFSKLSSLLAQAGATFDRKTYLVCRDNEPVAIALFPGLPPTWNLRKTCNCIWLFPFLGWCATDRMCAYPVIQMAPEASHAPGILEVAPMSGSAGIGKWLEWRMLGAGALMYFESWIV